MNRAALDVSELPSFAFGKRSILWWATMAMIAIEGTVFALMIAAYIYLKWREPHWPPAVAPPDLFWGTVTTIVVLLSAIPNELTRRAAMRLNTVRTRVWITASTIMAGVFCVTRAYEFTALNCRWDTNAYGSVVWTLLGLHTAHVVTDMIDTGFLAVITFTGRLDANRFVDISENALYYYFVIASWLPIYGLLYFAPRLS